MLFYNTLLLIYMPVWTVSVPFGKSFGAQLIGVNSTQLWLNNQPSWSQCMCEALKYDSPSIVAFNYFSNRSCQLITNEFSVQTLFYLVRTSNSIAFLLSDTVITRLTSICCADLSWLMAQIQQPYTFNSAQRTRPDSLALDTDGSMFLLTNGNGTRFIQGRDLTRNMTGRPNLFARTDSRPVSYHEGFFYVGVNPPAASGPYLFSVHNRTLTRAIDLSFTIGSPQRAVWLFNSSIMCVILQRGGNSSIGWLNWYPSSFGFTWNRTIGVPFNKPYGLAKANDDSMVYIGGDTDIVYQLSPSTFNWSILVPTRNSSEIVMTLIVDSCGHRLWVLLQGFGVRVYHRLTGLQLGAWDLSANYPNLYDMILTPSYEFFAVDPFKNELFHYGSSLAGQCNIGP